MDTVIYRDHSLPDVPPDNDKQWHNKFFVRSEKSSNLYTVSQHIKGGYWGCNCAGWRIHKKCKHLSAIGLPANMVRFDAKIK
jgi:hypothetical protein